MSLKSVVERGARFQRAGPAVRAGGRLEVQSSRRIPHALPVIKQKRFCTWIHHGGTENTEVSVAITGDNREYREPRMRLNLWIIKYKLCIGMQCTMLRRDPRGLLSRQAKTVSAPGFTTEARRTPRLAFAITGDNREYREPRMRLNLWIIKYKLCIGMQCTMLRRDPRSLATPVASSTPMSAIANCPGKCPFASMTMCTSDTCRISTALK